MRTYNKYSGAGNDFLIFEDLSRDFPEKLVPSLCHRKSGIGSDGLILWRHSQLADCEMVYFNSDGSKGAMCGNGLRCFVHFLRDQGIVKPLYKVEVAGKVLTVKCDRSKIYTLLPQAHVLHWDLSFQNRRVFVVDTGVPHAVVFEKEEVNVLQVGMALRNWERFSPEGVNVNFVWVKNPHEISVRTYERGVENETLACGTGSAAAAYVANKLGKTKPEVKVNVRSGECLEVALKEEIELVGPSVKISEGKISG